MKKNEKFNNGKISAGRKHGKRGNLGGTPSEGGTITGGQARKKKVCEEL